MQLREVSLVATPSQAVRRQCLDLIVEFTEERLTRRQLQERLLALDPWHPLGLYGSACDAWDAGDLEAARDFMWRCLWCMPQDFRPLFGMYALTAEEDREFAAELLVLAMRRYREERPEWTIVEELTRRLKPDVPVLRLLEDEAELDRMLKDTRELRDGEAPQLIPFWAADQLADIVGDEEDEALVARMLAAPEVYAGVLTGLCSVSGGAYNPGPGPSTVGLSMAVLGEMGRMEYVPAIAARCADEDIHIRHYAMWALSNIARQHGKEFVEELRRGVEGQNGWPLSPLVAQLWLRRRKPGMEQLLVKLLRGRAGDEAWEYDLNLALVADGLLGVNRKRNAPLVREELRTRQANLSESARLLVQQLLDGELHCDPMWASEEFAELSLDEVLYGDAIWLMVDEMEDEAAEDDEFMDDFDDDFDDEIAEPIVAPVKPGRNEPCWCGSGKKYKKCHLAEDEAGGAEEEEPLTARLMKFALDNVPPASIRRESERFGSGLPPDAQDLPDYFFQWMIYDYHCKPLGDTVARAYMNRFAKSDEERELLKGWAASAVAIYEVEETRRDEGVALLDVMRQKRLFVHDQTVSRSAVRYDYLLARLEWLDGKWLFQGDLMFVPRLVAPEVLRRLRAEQRPGESWDDGFKRLAPDIWRWVTEGAEAAAAGPQLATSTGEALEHCRGVYELLDEEAVKAALRTSGLIREEEGGTFVWVDPAINTVMAWLRINDERMVVETMSRVRLERCAEMLKNLVPGPELIHIKDECEKLDVAKIRAKAEKLPRTAESQPEGAASIVMEHLEKHYASWPDIALPALGGRTPREAIQSEEGRAAVETLLRDFENAAARGKARGQTVYDFSRLRQELGME
jgi:hypothetical protein